MAFAIRCSERNALLFAPRLQQSYNDSDMEELKRALRGQRRRRSRASYSRPRGLWNSGQSCHLGASIVALSAATCLRDWVGRQDACNDHSFTIIRKYLFQAAWSRGYERALDPRPVLSLLEGTGWKSRHAQDAHETMAKLLEIIEDFFLLHNIKGSVSQSLSVVSANEDIARCCMGKLPALKTWSRSAWGRSPFSVISSSSNKCHQCGYISPVSFQQSILLTLPVPRSSQPLAKLLLESHMSDEHVEMTCENCHRYGRMTRRLRIAKFPEVLVLHLQKAVFLHGMVSASDKRAVFSTRLAVPVHAADGSLLRVETYRLRSVVRHKGTAGTWDSHFTAVVSQEFRDVHHGLVALAGGERWWHVNDERVSGVEAEAVCNPTYTYMVVYDRRPSVRAKDWKMLSLRVAK